MGLIRKARLCKQTFLFAELFFQMFKASNLVKNRKHAVTFGGSGCMFLKHCNKLEWD